MDNNYGGIVWTTHALERIRERGISQGDAWATWKRPDNSRFSKSKGAWIYNRDYGSERIEVVAKKNGKGEWIVLSVWSKRLRQKYNKNTAGKLDFLKKLKYFFRK